MKPNPDASPISEQELHRQYDEMLDDIYPDLTIAGLPYCTSRVLKEIDPTAYRCGFADWLDSGCSDDRLVYNDKDGEYYAYDDCVEEE